MKKRILSIILSVCMVIMMMPQAVFAETYGDYEYSVISGEATIIRYNGSDEEVTIPSTIDGYPVKDIGDSAFYGNNSIKKVVIQNGVTSIGNDAFYNCHSLESINIPEGVVSIGDYAFSYCDALKSINIPSSVKKIGLCPFIRSKAITEITVDENNEYYSSENGFLYNKNKTTLIACPGGYSGTYDIPDTVTSINNNAFLACYNIEGVTIPDGVATIGRYVFFCCSKLKNVTIPSSVTSIGEGAFEQCISLEYINIPESVTTIGEMAFYMCSSLKSIVIPHKVTSISDRTFTFCSNLESVFLSENVTSIGVAAIPDTVSQIRYSLDETAGKVTITDVSLGSGRTAVEIPSYIDGYPVSAVKASAFDGCDSLERIFLPENISVPDGEISNTATKVSYSLDTDKGEVTITKIELASGKTNVDIPEKIFGYPVAAVAESEQSKVGAHTCTGGTATCTKKAVCSICGKEYGELGDHSFTAETIKEDALKTAGTCTSEAVYYYSCSVCGEVELDANHTFTGKKDPDNHTGELVWDKNETRHKQYYSCCGKVTISAEDHDWENGVCGECDYVCDHLGGTATCTEKAVCKNCGIEYGEIDPDNHTGEQVWIQTATQHEQKWNCCDEITVAAVEHSWENGVCGKCDYVCEHSYEWQSGDGKYWQKCSVCGVETAKTDLPELTIDAPDKVCRTQDCEISVLLPDSIVDAQLAFEFDHLGGGLKAEAKDGKISGVLTADGYVAEDNSFVVKIYAETDDGYLLTASKTVEIQNEHSGGKAACTKKAVCEICGEEYGELDSTNHELEHVPAKAATTSQTGNKEYWRCKNCGKYFSDKDGKNEITFKDVEIAKLAPESKPQTNTSSASPVVKTDESPSTGNGGSPLKTMLLIMSGGAIFAAWACGKKKNAKAK